MDRWNLILDHLSFKTSVSIAQLCEKLRISRGTARRDLRRLSDLGMLKLVRGGAVRLGRSAGHPPRTMETSEETTHQRRYANESTGAMALREIARIACALVDDTSSVILDGGEAAIMMASMLSQDELHVFTPSIEVFKRLVTKPGIRLFLPGGQIESDGSICMNLTEDPVLNGFTAKRAFVSCTAVNDSHVLAGNSLEVTAKRKLIERAEQVVLLAPANKLEATAPLTVCALGNIHHIITDSRISAHRLEIFRAAGIQVRVARLRRSPPLPIQV